MTFQEHDSLTDIDFWRAVLALRELALQVSGYLSTRPELRLGSQWFVFFADVSVGFVPA